jgi:uncharacterized membrane protein HdeD (DUF308 family)
MSATPQDMQQLQRAVTDALHQHWRMYLIEGFVLIVLGALAIIVPQVATLALTIFLGWLLLVSGAIGLVMTFWMRAAPGFWWSLISAALGVLAGGVLVARPVAGAVSLTLVLIAFFVIEGVASIMFALEHRVQLPGGWAWMLVSGIVDLVLSVMIFTGLPSTAAWAIGLLLGINLLLGGTALAAMALQARRLGPGAPPGG